MKGKTFKNLNPDNFFIKQSDILSFQAGMVSGLRIFKKISNNKCVHYKNLTTQSDFDIRGDEEVIRLDLK